jgi:hypothetical protein
MVEMSYTVSAPIKDNDGSLLGVSVLRYKPDNFFSIVTSENGLGSSEENFLVNKDKFFITPSNFLGDDVILTQKVETQNVADCFNPEEIEYIKKMAIAACMIFLTMWSRPKIIAMSMSSRLMPIFPKLAGAWLPRPTDLKFSLLN